MNRIAEQYKTEARVSNHGCKWCGVDGITSQHSSTTP